MLEETIALFIETLPEVPITISTADGEAPLELEDTIKRITVFGKCEELDRLPIGTSREVLLTKYVLKKLVVNTISPLKNTLP